MLAVPAQSRSTFGHSPRRAATAAMGTRKFSVNSSLLARVRAMKPMLNATAEAVSLFVSCLTSRRANTPMATSRPPTRPVASKLWVLRFTR